MALNGMTGATTLSIHTGAPGDSGTANEVSGGAYARQSITLGAASSRSRSLSGSATFEIPAGTTVSHYAIWMGATCVDAGALSASQTFATAGQLQINAGSISIT